MHPVLLGENVCSRGSTPQSLPGAPTRNMKLETICGKCHPMASFYREAPGGERVASHDTLVADPQLHSQLPGISPGTFLCFTSPHFRIRPLPGPSLCSSHSHFGWQETALDVLFTCLSLRVELLNGDTTFSFFSLFPAFYIPGSVSLQQILNSLFLEKGQTVHHRVVLGTVMDI